MFWGKGHIKLRTRNYLTYGTVTLTRILADRAIAWYNFFLESIFLSSTKASIKKKSEPKSDKVATNNKQTNKQTNNNKRPFFLPKINKVFLRPILQNLKGRSVLDKFFFENDPFDEPNQMPLSKKFYLFRKLVKIAK